MTAYQTQVIDSYNYAKRQMFKARNKYERGTWMILFEWSRNELLKIKMTPAATGVSR
jgi:hypothetical protein